MQTEHPPEQVLVIPAKLAEALCNYKIFGPASPVLEKIILDNHSFRDREEAEKNYEFKQVIPYVVVKHRDRYLLSQRTSKQQETRLHNKYSIGQGGHINDMDLTKGNPIAVGMVREINEEFTLGETELCGVAGVINDNSNDVGRVHLGLVYMLTVKSDKLHVAEEGKHIARWATLIELLPHYDAMENWSKIVMDHLLVPA